MLPKNIDILLSIACNKKIFYYRGSRKDYTVSIITSNDPLNHSAVNSKLMHGEINLSINIRYTESYIPSIAAKRSYLYLQGIGIFDALSGYLTRREELDSYLLVYTLSGEGILEYQSKSYQLPPETGFLIDCKHFHDYHISSKDTWSFMWFHFQGHICEEYYNQFVQNGSVSFSQPFDSSFFHLLERLFEHQQSMISYSELITSCILTNILTELIITRGQQEKELKIVPNYIEEILLFMDDYYDTPINLDTLSERFSISKFHLSREFKKHTGFAPNEYLINLRINRSKELLKYTSLNIYQISQQLGIANVNHYIYLFKSREGMTPTAFRKQWSVTPSQNLFSELYKDEIVP